MPRIDWTSTKTLNPREPNFGFTLHSFLPKSSTSLNIRYEFLSLLSVNSFIVFYNLWYIWIVSGKNTHGKVSRTNPDMYIFFSSNQNIKESKKVKIFEISMKIREIISLFIISKFPWNGKLLFLLLFVKIFRKISSNWFIWICTLCCVEKDYKTRSR